MNYEKTLCRFYSRISQIEIENIEEIPSDVLEFLTGLDCRDMKKPFILEELKQGKNEGEIRIKIGVDRMVIRWIKLKFGYK